MMRGRVSPGGEEMVIDAARDAIEGELYASYCCAAAAELMSRCGVVFSEECGGGA